MLVLSRKVNETIHLGNDIVIKVVKIRGNVVGLGIEAPESVHILRGELHEEANRPAAATSGREQGGDCPNTCKSATLTVAG